MAPFYMKAQVNVQKTGVVLIIVFRVFIFQVI